MKVLVFIEADIVVRHFLHSRVFDRLAASHSVRFVFPELGYKRIKDVDPAALDLPGPYEHLPVHVGRQRLWKWLYLVHQLAWRPGAQAKALRRLHRHAVGPKAALLMSVLGLPGVRPLFTAYAYRHLRAQPYESLEALLDRERPDVIVHPCVLEGVYLNDLVEASQHRGIPLVVIMNSWDNPSTKRAMVGTPDWLLVWGEQTFRHAVDLARMPPARTLKFGAAQFEAYRSPPRIDREEFCRINGIDPKRRILLYAGSSKGTDEIRHLTMLDEAVERGELGDTVVLYRPHPWGGGGKGGAQLLDQPWRHVRIESSMRGYLEQVRGGVAGKYLADYRDTHDVLSNIDALVSPLSTIILEAALHGKPAMCFMPDGDGSAHFEVDARLMHFQDMFRMPEIVVANGYAELVPKASELLQRVDDPGWAARLAECAAYFVEPHDRPWDERFAEFLEGIVSADTVPAEDVPARVGGR